MRRFVRNCVIILKGIEVTLYDKIKVEKSRTILIQITIYSQSPEKLLVCILWILKSKKINSYKADYILFIKFFPYYITYWLGIKVFDGTLGVNTAKVNKFFTGYFIISSHDLDDSIRLYQKWNRERFYVAWFWHCFYQTTFFKIVFL